MNSTKRRITVDQVVAHTEWARTLYLQGARPQVETERGRRHLTGAALRHTARTPKTDRDARRSTP